jgi:antitoxin FitA-like protein
MPGLLIKQLPPELHRRLKDDAGLHHRSMTRHALALLESALTGSHPLRDLPPPFRGRLPITKRLVDRAKRAGRL